MAHRQLTCCVNARLVCHSPTPDDTLLEFWLIKAVLKCHTSYRFIARLALPGLLRRKPRMLCPLKKLTVSHLSLLLDQVINHNEPTLSR